MFRKRFDISANLRSLRRRVPSEGDTFFRVICPGFGSRDFGRFEFETSVSAAREAALNYALDLASFDVGSSAFVSERCELDGAQVLVSTFEVSYSLLGGLDPCP